MQYFSNETAPDVYRWFPQKKSYDIKMCYIIVYSFLF